MSSHARTRLHQWAEAPPKDLRLVAGGLGYSQGGDTFEFDDWQLLVNACEAGDHQAFQTVVLDLLPKYERLWQDLGQPRNAGDWLATRYVAKS